MIGRSFSWAHALWKPWTIWRGFQNISYLLIFPISFNIYKWIEGIWFQISSDNCEMPSEKKVNTIDCNKFIQIVHKWHPCLSQESHIFLVPFHQCTRRTLWRRLRCNSRKLWRPATETQLLSNFQAPYSRIESDIDYHNNVAHVPYVCGP